MQEWLHVTGAHNKVEYCSGSHLKESSFQSKDLSFAVALSLGRGLRRIVFAGARSAGRTSPKEQHRG